MLSTPLPKAIASATSFAADRLTWILEARVLAPTPNNVKKEAREMKISYYKKYKNQCITIALWRHADSGVNTANLHIVYRKILTCCYLNVRLTLVVGGFFQRAGDICSVKVQGLRVMADGA